MFIKAVVLAALLPVLAAVAPSVSTESAERVGDPYPLSTCAVSGETFEEGEDPITKLFDGREVKFCCNDCAGDFADDLEASMAKLDEQIIASQRKHYPITTCIIGTGPLGSMGDPVEIVYNNRLVRFCCAGCLPKFNKDPEAALAKLDAMIIEQQRAAYPFNECLISGESFDEADEGHAEQQIEFVVANRLFRVCCDHCQQEVMTYPAEYLAQLDAAYATAQRDDYPLDTCAVSGEALGSMGDPIELVAGNTLIKLCCKGCLKKVNADPAKYSAMVVGARD